MAQTVSRLLTHTIFSTKGRRRLVTTALKDRLYAYMTQIVNDEFGYVLRINGTEDHVHLLVDLKTTTMPATMLRVVKSHSSKWVHETFPTMRTFAWQSGYGIFSVSQSQRDPVIEYIKGQEAHHRTKSFQEEFLEFLERYNIDYDERYIWD